MRVEVLDLTEENLGDAPEWGSHPHSCKYCTYWEFPAERADVATEVQEEVLTKKLRWLRDTAMSFGSCGKLAYVDGSPAGYAQYAPPPLLPRSADYTSGPPNHDAVLISCLYIPQREFRGMGLGSKLLEEILEDLRRRGIAAAETFARRGSSDNPSGPLAFYLSHGFRIHRDDVEFPLMRLDL